MANCLLFNLEHHIRNGIYADEPEYFKNVRASVPENEREMQLSAVEGSFLKLLVTLTDAKLVLEIGSGFGYSTLWLASGLSAGGRVIGVERSQEHYQIALQNIKLSEYSKQIELRFGDAVPMISNMPPKLFDMVFIDANKLQYQIYARYADSLLKIGGLVVMDDIYRFSKDDQKYGKMAEAIEDAQQYFINSNRFHISILPFAHGLFIARKIA